MKTIELRDELFRGAVSLEQVPQGWKPWRIPYLDAELFPPNGIDGKAEAAAGVRIVGMSGTTIVELEIVPSEQPQRIDCVIDGTEVVSALLPAGEGTARFAGLPAGNKQIELYFDQRRPVIVSGLRIDDDADWSLPDKPTQRWVTYGSSITQCGAADGPANTWPALVARKHRLDLTCLGYSGNCMLEPMVARTIRDLPADYLSCCIGINVYGQSALSPRTFKSAVIGLLQIIREKHPDTPLAVISPIYAAHRETTPNKVGMNLQGMREEIAEAVAMLRQRGDHAMTSINGLDLFGESYAAYLPDQLHPNAEGYRILAERFSALVVESTWKLGSKR